MNKITKKLCGILCASVAMLTIGGAKAYGYGDFAVSIPSSISPDNGNFSFNVSAYKDTTGMLGDVNQDGVVDLDDAQLVDQYYLKIYTAGINETATEKAAFEKLADINKDGKVDLTDAQKILRIALKIDTMEYVNSIMLTEYDTSDIKSVKYLIANKDSKLYSVFSEYYTVAEASLNDPSLSAEWNTKYNNLMTALNSAELTTSSDKKTINGSLGTTKADKIYFYVVVEANDGKKGYYFIDYDTSDASYWTFLKSSASTNVSNKTTINNGSTNESSSKTTTTTTEETVENPNTAVTVTVMGLVIAAVAGAIVAKKKNLFSRI